MFSFFFFSFRLPTSMHQRHTRQDYLKEEEDKKKFTFSHEYINYYTDTVEIYFLLLFLRQQPLAKCPPGHVRAVVTNLRAGACQAPAPHHFHQLASLAGGCCIYRFVDVLFLTKMSETCFHSVKEINLFMKRTYFDHLIVSVQ